ncbi:MAG: extracellular solute-binding protein [Butyrivibrio sp.]|uniref:extracellular solute-binding protein n=1 Tax=Butyrivibrio sp. TaxID=28121 RepID=UPI0025CCD27A|nr:extracellular solute-binding protein [Butyrivibrio sp.]MCR5770084.1 extracellular solute-binding protein [Butyrivibrio sp.]
MSVLNIISTIKRQAAAFIITSLLISGCGQETVVVDNTDKVSEYDEHLDISIAYWQIDKALDGYDSDEVLKKIEDKFNITIIPENITWDDYYSKIELWAENNTLPDIFVGAYRTSNTMSEWAEQGLLHEIPGDLSQYENLNKYMDSPETETCQIDGKTYCIFRQTYSEQAETVKDRTILYRWDLAKAAGITKEPENWDEFRTMIQAIINTDSENKDIEGMTAKDYSMLIAPLFTYSMPLAPVGDTSFYWVPNGEKYVPAIFAGETLGQDALPTWNLVRDMYDEGTIEEDILFTTTSQAEEKFLSGKSAAICIDGGISNTKTYENMGQYWNEIYGHDFFDDVKYLDLLPSVDGNCYYTAWDYAWSESYISSKVSDEKLDRILSLYDYLLSEEGTLLSNFGIADDTYSIDDNGKIQILYDKPSDKYHSLEMLASLVCWNYGNNDSSNYPDLVPESYVKMDEERVQKARSIQMPPYSYECTKALLESGSGFSIKVSDIFKEIMLSEKPVEEVWNDIINDYIDMGLLDVIDDVNSRL